MKYEVRITKPYGKNVEHGDIVITVNNAQERDDVLNEVVHVVIKPESVKVTQLGGKRCQTLYINNYKEV